MNPTLLIVLIVFSRMIFFLPLKDRRPAHRGFAWMTASILGVNVLVHIWVTFTVYLQPGATAERAWLALYPYMEVPQWILDGQGLGALSSLTSAFLHADLGHLLGNMFMLWFFGRKVEDSTGSVRFGLLYLFCGFMASLVSVIFRGTLSPLNATIPGLGASGAIAGIMAAYLFLYSDQRILTLVSLQSAPELGLPGCILPLPIPLWLPSWVFLLYNFITDALWAQLALELVKREGVFPLGVNVFAHLGGAAGGFLFIYFFLHPDVFAGRR
ncbi:MAG TPA: rhomboid family intramembrane serine protease [Anaerolineae bacterium]|jgi:membrane associated rhomboid family serine protease